jgi:hypothetical protein
MSARHHLLAVGGAAALLALWAAPAAATPRMSLNAGTPCIACHINPTGGGGRTELGWSAMSREGALDYGQLGLSSLHDADTNALFDGFVSVGLDLRVQAARLGNPTLVEDPAGGGDGEVIVPDVTVFPMQLQPYLAVKPAEGVTLYATFAAGPETFRGKLCDEVFPGMSCYEAFALYEPAGALPTVRAGVFQPAIGVRHDDHTLLIRGDARDRRRPIIAPNYAEPGAEVLWQPVSWFRAEAGGFAPLGLDKTLNENSQTADLWPVAYSARLTLQPYIKIPVEAPPAEDGFDDFGDFGDAPATVDYVINSWFGASAYGSGDFLMLNAFLGLGIHEGLSLVAELSHSQRTLDYDTLNGWVGLWYTPWTWLTGALRVERAQTNTALDESTLWSAVAGLELFPIPGVELRPEYRLVQTESYRFGQATVQLHLFY